VAYAMFKLEDRGPMMIEPGWKVYKGMIVGEHTRDNDLEINVLQGQAAHQQSAPRQRTRRCA
jgi:GTP-binding protein